MADENVTSETPTSPAGESKPEGQPQVQNAAPVAGVPDPATKTGDNRRDQGILNDLKSERVKRQAYERQFNDSQAQITELNRRIAALAGVTPQSAEEQDIEVIKSQFAKIYPELAGLSPDDIRGIREAVAAGQSFKETANHIWTMHAQSMVNDVVGIVADKLGGDLTERQARALTTAYVRRAEADPDFLARHEKGDPKLIQEFAQEWLEDWYEPARRSVTTTTVNQRRPVPNGRGNAPVTTSRPKVDYKSEKAVEDAAVAAFLEHGGSFGR